MARFGGELYNFEDMSDDEIREVVMDQLREHPNLDEGWIDVDVRGGHVTLTGRVGTDGESRIVENLVTDVLGLSAYSNELVIDELHRGETSMAIDEELAEEEAADDPIGGADLHQSDTAENTVEDLESETYGTHDMGRAIADGTAYIPPESPTPGGYGSGEDH